MSFLAPLYIAGALAIALPIIFHLIRRSPQGRQQFSSLMFLAPSPPTLTRRSRLTNILLLILRATALILLAIAFARPLFRQDADAGTTESRGRRVAILVDTSASMRRDDLWQQARAQVDRALGELAPTDEVGLFFFDRRVRAGMTFEESNELDSGRRVAMLRSRLEKASPGWDSTRIGDALVAAADLLAGADSSSRKDADRTSRQLVLISDMQRGGHAEALQRYEWPQNVALTVRPVSLPQQKTTNATVQFVSDSTTQPALTVGEDSRLRVRASNEPGASAENFVLAWANANGAIAGMPPAKLYVAPGRTQMARVTLPPPDQQVDRLVLNGDDADFDNTLYIVPPRRDVVRVVYLGDDGAEDTTGLRYYVESAIAQTPRRSVEFIVRNSKDQWNAADLLDARLVIVGGTIDENRAGALRKHVQVSGDVLWVVRDAQAASGARLAQIMGGAPPQMKEAAGRDFALISRVEFDHPLFAPLADPRFSDFSKVRFWKHRIVKLDERPGLRVLARFDSGDPFLIEQSIGRGRLLIATAGWHPADSQLALSTKFVPLIEGLLRRRDAVTVQSQHIVGEPIALPAPTTQPQPRMLIDPDGHQIRIADGATTFDGVDRPGIYRLTAPGQEMQLAVNVAPDESRTAPIAVEELEQWGVRLSSSLASTGELVTQQRNLQKIELENRQKLWRWIVLGVIGLLAAETLLAGRLARRPAALSHQEQQQVTS